MQRIVTTDPLSVISEAWCNKAKIIMHYYLSKYNPQKKIVINKKSLIQLWKIIQSINKEDDIHASSHEKVFYIFLGDILYPWIIFPVFLDANALPRSRYNLFYKMYKSYMEITPGLSELTSTDIINAFLEATEGVELVVRIK